MSWVFVSRMIGIICFLIVVVLANILKFYMPSLVYQSGVMFLNENFWLFILIAIIFLVADLFGAFPFPLNLPAPIIRAFGSVFCIAVIQIIFQWVDGISGTTLYQFFWLISFILVPFVFLIVLASGYYEIMRQLWWQPKLEPDTGSDTIVLHEEHFGQATQMVSDVKSWEEIGLEFRLMLFDIIHRFREDIQKKK
ncbi:MAG TPA: hypothetical protein VMW77_04785 [Methanoregula sp.]|nr:hypothetical protein [Methanoregula sp.]